MNLPTLWILRGLPGSGKSTLARLLASSAPDTVIASADDFFVTSEGVYHFDASLLPAAHAACINKVIEAFERGVSVVVDNTNTQRWEFEPYLNLARFEPYRVVVLDLFDGGLASNDLALRNTHGVPLHAIAAMRSRYEHDWRAADPRKPWER
jgi:predicted kinase